MKTISELKSFIEDIRVQNAAFLHIRDLCTAIERTTLGAMNEPFQFTYTDERVSNYIIDWAIGQGLEVLDLKGEKRLMIKLGV